MYFLITVVLYFLLVQSQNMGNPKTLTPGLWTPTTDRVCGLPVGVVRGPVHW